MKIIMTQTVRGSLDGLTVIDLIAGETYETVGTARGDRLARYHIESGVAVAFVEPTQAAPVVPAAPHAQPAKTRPAKAKK